MNKELLTLVMVCLSSLLSAQNVGIGTSNPIRRLDVLGGIKTDSLFIVGRMQSSNIFTVSTTIDTLDQKFDTLNAAVPTGPVPAWQSFTSGKSGVLNYVSFSILGLLSPEIRVMRIYEGVDTTGKILIETNLTLPTPSPSLQEVFSPLLSLPITEGQVYSIYLNRFSNWAFGTFANYLGGMSSFGANLDFGFATYLSKGTKEVFRLADGGVNMTNVKIGQGTPITKTLHGTLNIGTQPAALFNKTITLTFAQPFTTAPKVVAIVESDITAQDQDFGVSLKSVTTTSAIFSIRRLDTPGIGWNTNPKLHWWIVE
jgi:hypothetical protein